MNIRVILWDVDGTILNFEKAEEAAIRKGFQRFQLGCCTDEMLLCYQQINRKYWEALERKEMTKPEILVGRFREFFSEYGLDTEKAEAFNECYQVDLGDTICFNDGAYELIRAFHDRGFSQYVVTNGTKTAQEKKLRLSGIGDLMKACFISDEIGHEKPSKEFFDRVYAVLYEKEGEIRGAQILLVGDSLTSDIRGANNAGMKACWYREEGSRHPDDLRIDYEVSDLNELRDLL